MTYLFRFLCLAVFVTALVPDTPAQTRYATSVIDFSSEYNPSPASWSAAQALGSPNVFPLSGDIREAWASASPDNQREFLVLAFGGAAPVSNVWIYETYNPGAVDTVYVRNASTGEFVEVWSGTASAPPIAARINNISFPRTAFDVDAVRLAVNSPAVFNWNQIDAVALFEDTLPVAVGLFALSSTTIPAGSFVQLRFDVLNDTASPKTGRAFFYAERNGNVVAQGTITSDEGTVPAQGQVGLSYTQNVASSAPPGTYDYYVCVGTAINAPASCSDPISVTVTNSFVGTGEVDRTDEWEVIDSAPWPSSGERHEIGEAAGRSDAAVEAYPNPFARSTEIAFTLAAASDVKLTVYDVRGRAVATLADGAMEAGRHAVAFDAAGLPSGVYVYRLVAGSDVRTGRLTLVR